MKYQKSVCFEKLSCSSLAETRVHITEWSLNPTTKNALLFLKNVNCIVLLRQELSNFSCLGPF